MSDPMTGISAPLPSAGQLRFEELSRKLRVSENPAKEPGKNPRGPDANIRPTFSDEIRKYFPGIDQGKIPSEKFRLDRMPDPATLTGERKRLYQTSLEFQSLFINMMLKGMRATLHHEDDMLYGGRTQEIFEDMLYDEYSKSYSRSAGFPLAEQIYLQMAPMVSEKGAGSYEENLKRVPPTVSTDQIHREWKR